MDPNDSIPKKDPLTVEGYLLVFLDLDTLKRI